MKYLFFIFAITIISALLLISVKKIHSTNTTVKKEFKINENKTIVFKFYEKENSKSQVMVKIPGKNFKMDITEVTNKEYKKCVNAGKCEEQSFDSIFYDDDGIRYEEFNLRSAFDDDKQPVETLWQQAKNYCEWTGKRLPTEEEWEYAAKGGKNYKYSGSNIADEVAWYENNSKNKPHEVATKKANGYGLYDMSGNVLEWTDSWWDSSNTSHILRGGSYNDNDKRIEVIYRSYSKQTNDIGNTYGFRCVQ